MNVVLVLAVVSIPYLSKERILLGDCIIVPRHRIALRAPMAALENGVEAHLELMTECALPLNGSVRISRFSVAGVFTAAELSCSLNLLEGELFELLGLIITMVKLELVSFLDIA